MIFCWTRNLAARIESALVKRGITDATLAHLTFPSDQAEIEWEKELRAVDQKEAARLDALLDGRI
jgi:hypothetical protein